jgi:hypothetical protein
MLIHHDVLLVMVYELADKFCCSQHHRYALECISWSPIYHIFLHVSRLWPS